MKKKRTTLLPFGSKIILLALFGLLSNAKMQGQTTLYSQGFGTSLTYPTGWSASGTSSWALINDVNSSGYTGASGGSNVKILDASSGTKTLTYNNTTTPLSTVGYGAVTVIWGGRRFNNSVPSPILQWSSDGSTWNSVSYNDVAGDATWDLIDNGNAVTLPTGAAGISNLRLRWSMTFTSGTNSISYRFDDLLVKGISAPTVTGFSPSSLCAGGTITITGTNLGTATASTVKIGGTAVSSITSNNGTTLVAVIGSGTTGTVSVATAAGTATSASSCTVNTSASISAQPSSQSICSGSPVTFSVTAAGNPAPTYQWKKGASNISGATSSSYNIPSVSASDAASYTVVVSNTCNSVTSSAGVLTVNSAPSISVNPASQTKCVGNSVTFSVTTSGTPTPTYQWRKGGSNISGATASSYTISSVALSSAGSYDVVVTNTCGSATSSAASLAVNASPSVSASNNGPICSGNALNLSSNASGVSFQWGGPSSFSSTQQNPTRSNATTAHSGTYTVTVTDLTTSCTATATTSATVNATPSASASNNGPVCSGNTLSLTGGPGSQSSYVWSGPNGYTSSSQSPARSGSTIAMTGTYTITVTSSAGCSATATTSATVNQMPTAVIGSNSPVCKGSALNLTSSGGTSSSWDGPNNYSSSSLNPTVASAQLSHSGTYVVTVSSNGCTATASTTVAVSQTTSTAASSASSVCAGTSINLTSSSGLTRSNYNSLNIPDNNSTGVSSPIVISGLSGNLNNSTIKIVSVKINVDHSRDDQLDISLVAPDGTLLDLSSDNGGNGDNYSNTVFLNGASTNITAGSAPFTGNFLPEAPFSNLNGKNPNGTWNLKVADDASSTTGTLDDWEITFSDNNGVTYAWNSTPSGYSSNAQNPSCIHNQTSTYSVSVTGFGCTGVATTNSVTAKPSPDLASYSNSPICLGNGISLGVDNVASGQTSGNTYAWTGPDGFTSTQQNPSIGTSTAPMNGNYSVIVTNQFLCTASSITGVDIHELPVMSVSAKTDVTCFGLNNGTVQLSATGGTSPYDFTDFINFNNSGNFTDLAPGSYTYYVSDAYGCANTVSFGITEPDLLQVSNSNSSPACVGTAVNLSSNVVGGTMPYTYSWVGQNGFTSINNSASISSVNLSHAGAYTLDITDANGCTAQHSTSIVVDLPASVSAGSDQSFCSPATFTLNGSVGGSATSGTWTTNGDGSFDNAHALNAVYTPGANDLLNVKAILTFTTDNPNTCGAVSQQVNVKAHSAVPAMPVAVNGATSVCPPVNGLNLSVQPSINADSYLWEQGPTTTGISFETPVDGISVNVSVALTGNSTYNVRVTPINACGSGAYKTIQLRRSVSAPSNPAGPTVACPNDIKTYSIPSVTGAESFTWTAPSGSLINGNPTPYTANVRTVDVTFPVGFTSGQVGVTANVACFSSVVKSTTVSTNTVALSTISGSSTVCPGGNYTFTVPAVSGAVSYQWVLPTGVTGTSASNSINVTVTNAFVSGSIGVKAYSTCGNPSALRTKSVVRGTPSVPSSIAGPSNGVCSQTAIYTCPTQAGATYNWTVPSGATVNTGNGSNAIEAGFGTFSTGPVCVTATNSCGSSAARCITVKGAPNSPSSISVIPSNWCANEVGIEFTAQVSNVSGAYSIKWIYPGSNVADYVIGGGNSTNLVLDWKNGSGNVIAMAYNACGSGSRQYAAANDNCRKTNENASGVTEMTVFPNPATDNVSVRFYNNKNEVVTLKLIDLSGREINVKEVNSFAGSNDVQVDLSKLAKGAYLMSLKTSAGTQLKKITLN